MFYFIISKTSIECIVLKTYPELGLDDLRKSGVVCHDAREVRPGKGWLPFPLVLDQAGVVLLNKEALYASDMA
jgi:hypothetical protein